MLPSFIFCQYLSDKNIPQPLLLQLFSYFLIISAIIGKECLAYSTAYICVKMQVDSGNLPGGHQMCT